MTRRFPPPVPGLPSKRERYRTIFEALTATDQQPTLEEFVPICQDAIVQAESETDRLSSSWTKHILRDLVRSGFIQETKPDDEDTTEESLVLGIDSRQWLEGELEFNDCVFQALKRGWVLKGKYPEGFEALEKVLHVVTYELDAPVSSQQIRAALKSDYDYRFSQQGIRGYPQLLCLMGWLNETNEGFAIPESSDPEDNLGRLRSSDLVRQYRNLLRREGPMVNPPSKTAKRSLMKYYMYRESGGWSKRRRWYEKLRTNYLKPSARNGTSVEPRLARKSGYVETEDRRSELRSQIKKQFGIKSGLRSLSVSELKRVANAQSQKKAREILVKQGSSLSRQELAELRSRQRRYEFDPEFDLYDWQREAADMWFNGTETTDAMTGVAEVVTGAGKTVMALEVIRRWLDRVDGGVVTIVVPTRVLLYQWMSELTEKLNVPVDDIGWAGDGHRDEFVADDVRVLVTVVNTAVKNDFLQSALANAGEPPHLLVADECHNYTGDVHSNVLEYHNSATLGLSATPTERPQSERDLTESEELLFGQLGEVYYTLTYSEAIKSSLIPRFEVKYVGFELTRKERQEYDQLSREVSDALGDIRTRYSNRLHQLDGSLYQKLNTIRNTNDSPHPAIGKFFELTQERRDLVNNAICRQAISLELLKDVNVDEKTIVFQEKIEQLEQLIAPREHLGMTREGEVAQMEGENYRSKKYEVYPKLKKVDEEMENLFAKSDFWPVMYHSGHRSDVWNDFAMEWFRADNHANVMYSVKALIEGVDVPDADTGIVRVSSGSVRQRIQTLGRILRTGDDPDEVSELYVLYARNTVDENIFREYDWEEQLGSADVDHYVWAAGEDPLEGEIVQTDEPLPAGNQHAEPSYPDASELEPGDPYSGPPRGFRISVDSDGRPFEKTGGGRKFIANSEIKEAAEIVHREKGGGTIIVTEPGHLVTKLPDGPIFLGVTQGPDSFEYEGTQNGSLTGDPPEVDDLFDE